MAISPIRSIGRTRAVSVVAWPAEIFLASIFQLTMCRMQSTSHQNPTLMMNHIVPMNKSARSPGIIMCCIRSFEEFKKQLNVLPKQQLDITISWNYILLHILFLLFEVNMKAN